VTIEDLIRSAQERQAARAVPQSHILATLAGRASRRRRQQRWAMTGAVAAVAAIVAVPVVASRPSPSPDAVAAGPTSPSPSPSAAPTRAPMPDIALGFRPGWMPSGFSERIRQFTAADPSDGFGPTLTRTWRRQVGAGDPFTAEAEVTLYVRTAVPDPAAAMDTSGSRITINGHAGYYSGTPGENKSTVDWVIGSHTLLMVSADHLTLSEDDLLRIARSVRSDAGTSPVPLRLPWLPDGWTNTNVTISGPSQAKWRVEISGQDAQGSLSVIVGSAAEAPAGGAALPMPIAGHPARHPVRTDKPGIGFNYLVLDLGHGRYMTLVGSGAVTFTDLTKIAYSAEVLPAGLGWL
jgi:hypothetical protein